MTRNAASTCVLLLIAVSTKAVDEPPSPAVEDWFGIDVEAPGPSGDDKRQVRLKAFAGNNLTALALQFFEGHVGKYNETDFRFVVDHLEEAAGGKCDACKTLVELMSERFIEMGLKFAKVTGTDQFGKPIKSMHVEPEQESYIASLCKAEKYNDYAPHIRKGCWDTLSAEGSRSIFQIFHNGTLGPETVVARKVQLCGERLKVCEVKPATPSGSMGQCRACGEVMEDLSFLLRRASRSLVLGGDALRKKMSKVTSGYLSKRHILRELEDLCMEIEGIHPPSVKDDLVEMCETLAEEYQEDIVAAFVARPQGHQLAIPGKEVCVKAAELCSEAAYNRNWPLLESYPYNFSYYRGLPEKNLVPDDDRVGGYQAPELPVLDEYDVVSEGGPTSKAGAAEAEEANAPVNGDPNNPDNVKLEL